MKRNFTSFIAFAIICAGCTESFGQSCLTGGSISPATVYTFDQNTQGFNGDFGWTSSASGELESSPVSGSQAKVLKTATLFLPNSATTITWGFDLSGTATVNSYTVEALYDNGSNLVPVLVCSGTSLNTNGSSLVFAAAAPAQIIGTNFILRITFDAFGSGSSGSKVLDVDNFITNGGSSPITLPVNFTYFGASAGSGGIQLTWMVASELNVNHYDVERSSNGKSFSKIGSVNSSGLITYTYLDKAYNTGSNYYRLKAVDNDGKYKYSTVVLFKVGKNTLLSTLKVYPVPATSQLTLYHDPATISTSINILSSDGRLIKTIIPVAGNTETALDISSFKAGLYLVRYSVSETESVTAKLVKQ